MEGTNQTQGRLKPQEQKVINFSSVKGLAKADWETALANKKKGWNLYKEDGSRIDNVLMKDLLEIQWFKKCPGPYLFFAFAKRVAILFIIMAVLTTPAMYNNFVGQGLSDGGAGASKVLFMQFSIANQPMQKSDQSADTWKATSELNKYYVLIPDAVYSLLLFVFYLYWSSESEKIVKEMKRTQVLPSYFTVTVKGLPDGTRQRELKEFFQRFGDVTEIAEVREYQQSLSLSKEIYNVRLELTEEYSSQKKNQKTIDKLTKQEKKLSQKLTESLKINKEKVLQYYVVFRYMEDRSKAIHAHRNYDKMCLCGERIPEQLLFRGTHLLHVSPCVIEPGSIIWENAHITKTSKFFRFFVQAILVLVALFIGFLLISLLNIASPQLTTSTVDTSSLSFDDVVASGNSTIAQSWCLRISPVEIYNNQNQLDLCRQYLSKYYMSVGISIGISVVIVLIKEILIWLTSTLSRFQRYKSYNQEVTSVILKIFITSIITSVIITILLQAKFGEWSFKHVVTSILNNSYLTNNSAALVEYSDMTRQWYIDIGYKLTISWIIIAFVPYFYQPIIDLIMEKLSQCSAKKQTIQRRMDKTYQADEFKFDLSYAELLTIMAITMCLGGPMPLLFIIGAVALLIRCLYWKYYFVRFCRRPIIFDDSLNRTICHIIPWIVFVHLAVSIFSYGQTGIFPSTQSISTTVSDFAAQLGANTSSFGATVISRATVNWILTIQLVLFIVVYLVKLTLIDTVRWLIKQCSNKQELPNRSVQAMSNKVIQNQDSVIAESYRIQNNEEYKEILSIMKYFKPKSSIPPIIAENQSEHRLYLEEPQDRKVAPLNLEVPAP